MTTLNFSHWKWREVVNSYSTFHWFRNVSLNIKLGVCNYSVRQRTMTADSSNEWIIISTEWMIPLACGGISISLKMKMEREPFPRMRNICVCLCIEWRTARAPSPYWLWMRLLLIVCFIVLLHYSHNRLTNTNNEQTNYIHTYFQYDSKRYMDRRTNSLVLLRSVSMSFDDLYSNRPCTESSIACFPLSLWCGGPIGSDPLILYASTPSDVRHNANRIIKFQQAIGWLKNSNENTKYSISFQNDRQTLSAFTDERLNAAMTI